MKRRVFLMKFISSAIFTGQFSSAALASQEADNKPGTEDPLPECGGEETIKALEGVKVLWDHNGYSIRLPENEIVDHGQKDYVTSEVRFEYKYDEAGRNNLRVSVEGDRQNIEGALYNPFHLEVFSGDEPIAKDDGYYVDFDPKVFRQKIQSSERLNFKFVFLDVHTRGDKRVVSLEFPAKPLLAAMDYGEKKFISTRKKWQNKECSSGESPECFITTAVCDHIGLGDNCFELRVLRNYRDKYLANLPDGKQEIKRYYSVAPSIVERLSSSDIPKLYFYYILPCAIMAFIRLNRLTLRHYKRMVMQYL